MLDDSSVTMLEKEFEDDEILNVFRGVAKDKASSPDSFSMAFFASCWEIVREDLLKVFQEFHSYIKFEKSLNTTFITSHS